MTMIDYDAAGRALGVFFAWSVAILGALLLAALVANTLLEVWHRSRVWRRWRRMRASR